MQCLLSQPLFLLALPLSNSSGSWQGDRASWYLRLLKSNMPKGTCSTLIITWLNLTHTHTHTRSLILQHPHVCLCHYVHTLGSVPGTVRIPGKDAVVAGCVSVAVRERELHHARRRAHVHAHLREEGRCEYHRMEITPLIQHVCACDGLIHYLFCRYQ